MPPRVEVHDAVAIGLAGELGFALDLSAEEALAALARDHRVVQTAGLVAADQALLLGVVHRHFLKPGGRYKKGKIDINIGFLLSTVDSFKKNILSPTAKKLCRI